MRMICPVGSTSGPKSVFETTVPSTATFAALLTSCCVKKAPYFVGQLRMSGKSMSVPLIEVDQFWLPAMTCERLLTPAATYCTPGSSRSEAGSSAVRVGELAEAHPTPAVLE